MFEGYKKYLLIKYCWDCGTDDGSDHHTKKEAETAARRYIREGWETVACINTKLKRVEFVTGGQCNVFEWFRPETAVVLKQNSQKTAVYDTDPDHVDPAAIRAALAQNGIVNGICIDPVALDQDPFIQQIRADAERIAQADKALAITTV